MSAYSTMVASHGGMGSGECTPSMNQNADSSYSRRSSLNTVEYAYRSFHPSAPGGGGISNGLGNRSAMMFLLSLRGRWFQQGLDHAGNRVRGAGRGGLGATAP